MTELEEVYSTYFKDIYFFVYRLSKDRSIAEDVTSETFLKAVKSIDSFQENCDIRTWLFQIAKNTYFSHVRRYKASADPDLLAEIRDETDVEAAIFGKEESMEIHTILHQLPEPYKEVFSLRVFGELSYQQIGKLFGKTDNWACVTFHRARNKIKEEMRLRYESEL